MFRRLRNKILRRAGYFLGLITLILSITMVTMNVLSAPASATYYYTGDGGTGDGVTDALADAYDASQATWTTTANGQNLYLIKQYTTATEITTTQIDVTIYCDQTSSAGGDQIKMDWILRDCGTDSSCTTEETAICTGTQIDCENGIGTPAIETASCTPAAAVTIDENEYMGLIFTSATNKAAYPRMYYDTSTYPSKIIVEENEVAAGGGNSCACGDIDTNWEINLSENCQIEEHCDIGTGNLTFIETGSVYINSTINVSNINEPVTDQSIYLNGTGRINVG